MTDQLQTQGRKPKDIVGTPENVRTDAISTLWNMSIIAEADMMTRGLYVDEKVSEPARSGAICGGHRACAIGSLFLGAQVPLVHYSGRSGGDILSNDEVAHHIKNGDFSFWSSMPNVGVTDRYHEFKKRPYLGLAYRALNNAAMEYVIKHDEEYMIIWLKRSPRPFEGPAEGWAEVLFESKIIPDSDLGKIFVRLCDKAAGSIRVGYYSDLEYHGVFTSWDD